MVKLPELKKKIGSFLTKEDGKISKENLVKAGVLIAALSIGAASSAKTASGAVSCTTDCTDLPNPADCSNCDTTEILHRPNALGTPTYVDNQAVATHNHCAQSCHASHSSHSSCCFPENTMIATATGKVAIQNIKKGDKVISYDLEKKEVKETVVLEIESPEREGYYKLNNGVIKVTNEHPFYTKKKDGSVGWAAIDRENALKDSLNMGEIMSLKEGDFIFNKNNGWVEIKNIKFVKGNIKTYNLKKVGKYNNFFAEDFLVHNKGGWC